MHFDEYRVRTLLFLGRYWSFGFQKTSHLNPKSTKQDRIWDKNYFWTIQVLRLLEFCGISICSWLNLLWIKLTSVIPLLKKQYCCGTANEIKLIYNRTSLSLIYDRTTAVQGVKMENLYSNISQVFMLLRPTNWFKGSF